MPEDWEVDELKRTVRQHTSYIRAAADEPIGRLKTPLGNRIIGVYEQLSEVVNRVTSENRFGYAIPDWDKPSRKPFTEAWNP
jgi:hypothetical protein